MCGLGDKATLFFYQFESPLLRLMVDEEYEVLVQGSQERFLDDNDVAPDSIWIHRFYDVSASSWAKNQGNSDLRRRHQTY